MRVELVQQYVRSSGRSKKELEVRNPGKPCCFSGKFFGIFGQKMGYGCLFSGQNLSVSEGQKMVPPNVDGKFPSFFRRCVPPGVAQLHRPVETLRKLYVVTIYRKTCGYCSYKAIMVEGKLVVLNHGRLVVESWLY